MDALEDVVFLYNRVIELDLGVLLFELLLNLPIGHRSSGSNQVTQFVDQDVFFDQFLELRNGVAVTGNEVLVGVLPDKLAFRENNLSELSLMQKIAEIFISSFQAHAAGFGEDHFLVDEI